MPADRTAFRAELLALIEAIDRDRKIIPWSDSPQGFGWKGFNKYPTLAVGVSYRLESAISRSPASIRSLD
jgi:hypothetical protein